MSPSAFPVNPALQTFNSSGSFLEGAYVFNELLTAGLRYDRFPPQHGQSEPAWAVTPYVNIPLNNGFQLIAEYQRRNFQLDTVHDRRNDTFQVRIIFIQRSAGGESRVSGGTYRRNRRAAIAARPARQRIIRTTMSQVRRRLGA